MVNLARIARSEGLLALENHMDTMEDAFLKKGVQLVVDGAEPEVLRDVLDIELDQLQSRHSIGRSILDSMGAACRAVSHGGGPHAAASCDCGRSRSAGAAARVGDDRHERPSRHGRDNSAAGTWRR